MNTVMNLRAPYGEFIDSLSDCGPLQKGSAPRSKLNILCFCVSPPRSVSKEMNSSYGLVLGVTTINSTAGPNSPHSWVY